jgi:hypothetical protein
MATYFEWFAHEVSHAWSRIPFLLKLWDVTLHLLMLLVVRVKQSTLFILQTIFVSFSVLNGKGFLTPILCNGSLDGVETQGTIDS